MFFVGVLGHMVNQAERHVLERRCTSRSFFSKSWVFLRAGGCVVSGGGDSTHCMFLWSGMHRSIFPDELCIPGVVQSSIFSF